MASSSSTTSRSLWQKQKKVFSSSVLCCCCLLSITLEVVFFSPISHPLSLQIPPPSFLPTNTALQGVIKLGEGLLEKPEDVCMSKDGILYTATRDGWIKRMHRNGTWENWKMVGGSGLLGIIETRTGGIIVCDTEKGLLKVGEEEEEGVSVLASHINGTKISFADDVIEASDGSLYFSVASTKFGLHEWYLDVLEAKPHGQLLKYDPSLNETSVVLDGLSFPNDVALSQGQDYLLVCETWKFRCLKYWLDGEEKGKTEIFVENLPGAPDNIKLAPDGTFWIAQLELTSTRFNFIHTSKFTKQILATFPRLIKRVAGLYEKAAVVKVASDGKIIKKLDDPTGEVMSFVTSVLEYEDHLYLGSLNSNFIGKLQLN